MVENNKAFAALRFVCVSLIAFAVLVPLAVMLATSFKTERQIFDSGFTFLFMPSLESYRTVLEGRFLGYLGNSVIVGVVSTVLTLLLGTMCAYALSRFKFLGRSSLAFSMLLMAT